ncbi:hypothetical protein D3C71_2002920 [compost metagenome]
MGVMEAIATKLEMANAPPTPIATPTSAITIGSPAATTEPRVMIRTMAAIMRPYTSLELMATSAVLRLSLGSALMLVPASASVTAATISSATLWGRDVC